MYKPNVPLLPKQAHAGERALFAEVLYSSYTQPRHSMWCDRMCEFAQQYGFNHINIHGAPILPFVTLRDYPLVTKKVTEKDARELAGFRSVLKLYKEKGLRITLGSGGVKIPDDLFECYPDARNIHSGLLMDIVESMIVEYFETIPEADAFEIYFWEAMLVSDGHLICPEMFFGGEDRLVRFASFPYYAPEDFLADIISAYGRGAQRAGKQFSLLTFSHHQWQEEVLIKAIERVDRSLPIILDHKCQPGDWTPKRLTNNVLKAFPAHPAAMLFDGAGEYWGQCRIPYCYPEEIAHRLQYALDANPSISEVGMRVMWHYDAVFGNYNEINFYALKKLAADPYSDIGTIWDEWTRTRFGRGAESARRALSRTADICNRIFYIEGAWIFDHSEISGLKYLESHIVNYSKAMIEWNSEDFKLKGRLRELLLKPSGYTLEWVLGERAEAVRLAELSLGEVIADQASYEPEVYEKLAYQLGLLVDISKMALMHMTLFLRYWIEKVHPEAVPGDNETQIQASCGEMEAYAAAFETKYGGKEPLIKPLKMRKYIEEIKEARGL